MSLMCMHWSFILFETENVKFFCFVIVLESFFFVLTRDILLNSKCLFRFTLKNSPSIKKSKS